MARLIDADALLDYLRKDQHESEVIEAVKDAHTVDAEKVVRCKKCYYYDEKNPGRGHCKYFDILRADNDFCSSGEER